MANVLAELFQNTANAIREKTGDTGTMKPAEFPEKIRAIETGGGGAANLVPLVITKNGTYAPNKSFDASGGTYRFQASYTQEYLSALYAKASAVYEMPINDLATAAFLLDNEDEESTALAVVRFALGENNFYCLMKNCAEPKVWSPVEVASVLGQSAEGWYTVVDVNTMALTPCDIPDYPIISGATYVVGADDIASLFAYDEFDGYSSVTVNVENSGSVEDAVVWNVTFIGADGSKLCQKLCLDGDACYDPVITGKISTPTKESTPQYTYEYNGWSLTDGGAADGNALSAVTSDRTVYAAFTANLVYYTVRFFDGETLMKTESVAYGKWATPPDTDKGGGFAFDGWTPSDLKITGDTDFYGTWTESVKLEAYTWEEIAAISESGEAANMFVLGDTKDIVFTYTSSNGTTSTITRKVQIVAFNHDNLSDGSGKAGITFLSTAPLSSTGSKATYSSSSSYQCWTTAVELQNGVNGVFAEKGYNNVELFSLIKTVNKLSVKYTSSSQKTDVTSQDKVWIPSVDELGNYYDFNDTEVYELFTVDKEARNIGYEYWLRDGSNTQGKLYVYTPSGGVTTKNTYATSCIRWGFCI